MNKCKKKIKLKKNIKQKLEMISNLCQEKKYCDKVINLLNTAWKKKAI